jgi:hypothetical protein
MLSARLLRRHEKRNWLFVKTEPFFTALEQGYGRTLESFLKWRWIALAVLAGAAAAIIVLLGTLPRELTRERFELVYCAPGTLAESDDLDGLVRGIRSALRSGGDLLVYDEHPVTWAVDGLMHWRDNYFADGRWRLGQVVSAVARAGLAVRALEEYPARHGNPRRHDARVPGEFLLYARRP